jgi:DNA-binding GntR family transcriptional regulator
LDQAATRTEEVYRRLRHDILGGLIAPGMALPFARLKDDYRASMGVLREALMRLTAEGLTVNQPHHGFKVISLSLEDLSDLTRTRCTISRGRHPRLGSSASVTGDASLLPRTLKSVA